MTLIMHILLETCPLVSSPVSSELVLERWLLIMMRVRSPAQVPGPGLERWDLMSAGRADRR